MAAAQLFCVLFSVLCSWYTDTANHCTCCSLAGRDLYVRNLSLLVPFLEDPQIQLKSLRQLPAEGRPLRRWQWPVLLNSRGSTDSSSRSDSSRSDSSRGSRGSSRSSGSSASAESTRLFAQWRLTCYVRLPWAPFVAVNGTTTYTLNEQENQVGVGCLQGVVVLSRNVLLAA